MNVTVLYHETGSGSDDIDVRTFEGRDEASGARPAQNAFRFAVSGGGCTVTLSDLVKAFPLGPSYHFDILGADGVTYESGHALDLSSPLPMTADGVITCRVFRLANAPRYASGGLGRMLPPFRAGSHTPSARRRDVGDKDGGQGQQQQQQQQQQHHHHVNVVKAAGKATKGLLGLVGNAVQRTAELLTHQEVTIGAYRVQIVKEMAEGGFSTVFLARDTRTKEQLALKRMLCQEKDTTEAAYREVQVLKAVRHRSVISLLDQVSLPSKTHPGAREFLLLFPFYERGTVWDAIVRATEEGPPWPYPEQAALRVFRDACCGIGAMHAQGYAHRDMKPLNLLVADDGSCIVMDVGSACRARREVSTRQQALLLEDEASVVCSAPYRPPELTSVEPGAVIDERVDVWALGCTLYAMAYGHSPFESPREGVMKLAILNGKFSFPRGRRGPQGAEYSNAFCDLVSWMLNPDPVARPRCPEVIKRIQDVQTRM